MVITRPNTPLVRVTARVMTETEIVPEAVMPVAVMIILFKDCPTTPKSSSNNQCCFNCDSPNHFVKDCPHISPRSRTPSPFNKNYNNAHFKDKDSKKPKITIIWSKY